MSVQYRACGARDIGDLIYLMAQLGYPHDASSLMSNIQLVRQQGGEVWVVEINSKVCGCISAIIDVRLAEGKKGEIVSLVVEESARGHGVGKGLVRHAEAWLSERVEYIRLRANTKREDAHLFYESLGYKRVKSQTIFDKNVE